MRFDSKNKILFSVGGSRKKNIRIIVEVQLAPSIISLLIGLLISFKIFCAKYV
jgi:hypothetical protein